MPCSDRGGALTCRRRQPRAGSGGRVSLGRRSAWPPPGGTPPWLEASDGPAPASARSQSPSKSLRHHRMRSRFQPGCPFATSQPVAVKAQKLPGYLLVANSGCCHCSTAGPWSETVQSPATLACCCFSRCVATTSARHKAGRDQWKSPR